jgi:P27 family predicted phage terminase small subunit
MPTKLLKLTGDHRAKERAKREPEPEYGIPQCPNSIEGRAREMWDRTAAALDQMGILALADGDALAAMCQNWALFDETAEALAQRSLEQQKGQDDESYAKEVMLARRLSSMMNEAYRNYCKGLAQFGLTPADRAGLELRPGQIRDELADRLLGNAKAN